MYELQEKDMIFIFTGPDGSGRKTLADMAGSTLGLQEVLSYTTRKPRSAENDGVDYHFISRDDFLDAERNGEFIESVDIDGNLYGIKMTDLESLIQKSGSIYMVMNLHGSDIIKARYGDKVVRLFVYADRNTVLERQRERGDSEEDIARHMSHYDETMQYMKQCEHAFENFESAHTIFALSKTVESYLNKDWVDKD